MKDCNVHVFCFIIAAPDVVPNVMLDLNTVDVMSDGINSMFTFILIWGVPFDNFDPIQNYIITIIGCTGSRCPLTMTTDNVTTSLDVSYTTRITNVTTMVTANNSIGSSNPAVVEVTGML